MTRYYQLSDSAAIKHRNRILRLLGCSALTAVVVLLLGLVRWSEKAYIGVNILLLAVAALAVIAYTRLGGGLDGKPEALKKTVAVGAVAAAAALWLFMTITGLHYSISIVIFLADVVLACKLAGSTGSIVKNVWASLSPDDTQGFDAGAKCQILLDNVHTGDSLTSPIGRVYISDNTVLFVLVDHTKGHILVNPSGSMEVRQKKLFSNGYKEGHISVGSILFNAEEGSKRIMQIVEEGCKKRNVPVPAMAYSYAMFLPHFERENYVYSESSYASVPWSQRNGSYKSYEKRASQADYFRGKACFKHQDIGSILRQYDEQFRTQNPNAVRTNAELDMIAQIIAEACELVPKNAAPELKQKYKEEILKRQAEYAATKEENK